jgi:hypothetical protein
MRDLGLSEGIDIKAAIIERRHHPLRMHGGVPSYEIARLVQLGLDITAIQVKDLRINYNACG